MSHSQPNIYSTRQAMEHALPFVNGKLLDAGGGKNAKYRSLFLSRAKQYVCLDREEGGHIDVVGDVLAMPFGDAEFDTVTCNQVLEHVSQPKQLVSEAFRVLKSGGHFICTAPFLEASHADPGDYFRYTVQGLSTLCKGAGFEIIEALPYGGFFGVIFSMMKFSWFSPYQEQTRLEKKFSRWLGWASMRLDELFIPRTVYADVLVIARK